jgi:hypothetical protein
MTANKGFKFEHRSSDVIAEGTTGTDGYGKTPMQRAKFIVDTIRIHLARQTCTHRDGNLSMSHDIFGDQVRRCAPAEPASVKKQQNEP